MKFEKLFEAKEHKLIDKNGNEIKITPDMAISVKWSEVEAAEEEYNEAFLAKLRDSLKTFESEEIEVCLNGEIKPIIINYVGNNDLTQLILPIRTY